MPKFQARGTYVVVDTRRKSEVARVATLALAKHEAKTASSVRLKWRGPETVDGVTTWYSDGDFDIRLESC